MRRSINKVCECCKKPLAAVPSEVSRGFARFCSRKCKSQSQPKVNLVRREFDYLTVIHEAEPKLFSADRSERQWLCECRCGTRKTFLQQTLLSGAVHSCGCAPKRISKLGDQFTDREIKRHLCIVLAGMKSRCYRRTDPSYDRYGGRGITICNEWRTNLNDFREWSLANGYAAGLTIDRINNDGPYSPDNCRWVITVVQANNKRTNVILSAFGETKTLTEWSRDPRCVVTHEALRTRIKKGWPTERSLTAPHYYRSVNT